jgi:hypothetical protein
MGTPLLKSDDPLQTWLARGMALGSELQKAGHAGGSGNGGPSNNVEPLRLLQIISFA